MEDKNATPEEIAKRLEEYGRSMAELYKLKTIKQFTESTSALTVRIFVFIAICVFLLISSLGAALWIGEELGEVYYGYFIVAGAYLLLAFFMRYVIRRPIRRYVANTLIRHILKQPED